jgi:hypothetical protein
MHLGKGHRLDGVIIRYLRQRRLCVQGNTAGNEQQRREQP